MIFIYILTTIKINRINNNININNSFNNINKIK